MQSELVLFYLVVKCLANIYCQCEGRFVPNAGLLKLSCEVASRINLYPRFFIVYRRWNTWVREVILSVN